MKNLKKSLDKEMQVKLPEGLEKDKVLGALSDREPQKKIKQFTARKLVPMAASLLVVVGLLGVYFSSPFPKEVTKAPETQNKAGNVKSYATYDSVYEKFSELKNEYSKEKWNNFIYDSAADFNTATDGAAEEMAPETVNGGSANKNFGTTNTQEADVDEGDIVKTDGKYIYVMGRNNQRVAIFDKGLNTVAKIKFEKGFTAYEMYLYNNYLVLVGGKSPVNIEETTEAGAVYEAPYKPADCCWGNFNYENATAYVYDVSDGANPRRVNEFSQQGVFKFARMIGSKLYLISNYYVDLADKEYKDLCIPEVIINGTKKRVPADCISIIENTKIPAYAVVTALDLEKNTKPATKAILGGTRELYASTENLYITETYYAKNEITEIHRFEYTDTGVEYKATGKVDGALHNQFSLSSQGEFLRVATTHTEIKTDAPDDGTEVARVVDEKITNNLYILDENMNIIGKAENLAEGERIQSARFVGNTAYIVTFRQTDPLFVIDTTDPCNPKVLSELKLPGFSEYLHPYGEGYLIGIGPDGTEDGTNGDCKVSLFDVRDPYNPKEISKQTVAKGQYNVDSKLRHNHKAFINLPDGEFAVPFNIWSNRGYAQSDVYIRYRVADGKVEETARYNLDLYLEPEGGTYIDDTFYIVAYDNYDISTHIIAYSLETNEQTAQAKV